jgi:hypothetical protein
MGERRYPQRLKRSFRCFSCTFIWNILSLHYSDNARNCIMETHASIQTLLVIVWTRSNLLLSTSQFRKLFSKVFLISWLMLALYGLLFCSLSGQDGYRLLVTNRQLLRDPPTSSFFLVVVWTSFHTWLWICCEECPVDFELHVFYKQRESPIP